MWRFFPSNYQRVVSSARRLPSQTTVALTSCNPCSNIVGNTTAVVVSGPCRRHVSSNNHHAAYASTTAMTTTLKNTNRYKSTMERRSTVRSIIPSEEEPAMGESLDESGYLGMILNAKVYDVAVETELQHAKSLSLVSFTLSFFFAAAFLYSLVTRLIILSFYFNQHRKQYNNKATQQYRPPQTRRHTASLFLQNSWSIQQNGISIRRSIILWCSGMFRWESCSRCGIVGTDAGMSCRHLHANGNALYQS
jgi:hypothetical protein